MSRSVPQCFLSSALAALLGVLPATPSFAWGPDGHRIVNRLAAERLPTSVPEFLRTQAAIDEIEYLGPEPDRWRSANEAELNAAQAPEHYIDLELADQVGKLPRRRYDFIAALYATGLTHPDEARDLRPEKVGLSRGSPMRSTSDCRPRCASTASRVPGTQTPGRRRRRPSSMPGGWGIMLATGRCHCTPR
jgi:hypothetical protein